MGKIFKNFGKDQYWHSIFGFVMSETDRPFGSEFLTHQNVFTLFKLNFFIFYRQWMEQTCFIAYMTYQVHTKGCWKNINMNFRNVRFEIFYWNIFSINQTDLCLDNQHLYIFILSVDGKKIRYSI